MSLEYVIRDPPRTLVLIETAGGAWWLVVRFVSIMSCTPFV